jgi:hypothetical protein
MSTVDRTPCIVRLRNRLDERLRRTGDQRELHIRPVLSDRVVDDGPALEDGFSIAVGQHETVGRFPDRDFADVADEQPPRAAAARGDDHLAGGVASARRHDRHVLADVVAQIFVEHAHDRLWRDFDRLRVAIVAHERQLGGGFGGAAARVRARFHGEQPAGRDRCAAPDLEPRAAERLIKLQLAGVVGERQRQRREPLRDGRDRVVADVRDRTAIEIEHRQRLQDVIQLRRGEGHDHVGRAGDGADVLEVPNAAFVQDDVLDRE